MVQLRPPLNQQEIELYSEELKKKVVEYLSNQNIANSKVLKADYIKTYQYGTAPVLCFEVETINPDNPFWLVFVNGDVELNMPNAAYNVNLFNHQTLDEMGLDVFQATFNYHIGMVISNTTNTEQNLREAKSATKH